MNKEHLWWIITLALLVGYALGAIFTSFGLLVIGENYPIVSCIFYADDGLNVESNNLPFTKESQREVIQWRCAKQFVNFSITDYEDILIFED